MDHRHLTPRPPRGASALALAALTALLLGGCGGTQPPSHTRSLVGVTPPLPSTPVPNALPGQRGVTTLARLRAPAGKPGTVVLTDQLLSVRGVRKVALYASQTSPGGVGTSSGELAGPLPLAIRPLVIVLTAGWCTPSPVELVWGLAARGRTVLVRTSRVTAIARRSSRAPGFDPAASVFYAFATGARVTVLVRDGRGATLASEPVNTDTEPYGCNAERTGPGPTALVPYTP